MSREELQAIKTGVILPAEKVKMLCDESIDRLMAVRNELVEISRAEENEEVNLKITQITNQIENLIPLSKRAYDFLKQEKKEDLFFEVGKLVSETQQALTETIPLLKEATVLAQEIREDQKWDVLKKTDATEASSKTHSPKISAHSDDIEMGTMRNLTPLNHDPKKDFAAEASSKGTSSPTSPVHLHDEEKHFARHFTGYSSSDEEQATHDTKSRSSTKEVKKSDSFLSKLFSKKDKQSEDQHTPTTPALRK